MATPQANVSSITQIWNFSKLKGQENYHQWSKKMKSALRYNGLWEIVENGMFAFPADLPEEETVQEQQADGTIVTRITVAEPTQAEAAAYQAELKVWKDLNNHASELIYSMCEDKPAEAIEDEEVAMNR